MENSSLSIFESNEKILFKLTKAAFHNSCGSNFVTLDFYENTHLSGTNGVGKSSKLNAIQIGYLPHNNFKSVEKNFYFVSKGKPYAASKVYEYHFPDLNSYIIYEFQNPHGTFCQIIYRGKEELSIERAFVPLTLDEIYDWFWIFEKDDELGRPTHLGYQQLIEKIKSVKGHKFSKSAKDNRNILYNGSPIDDDGKFSIAKIPQNKVENLIDIFKLAVNATAIDDVMIKKTVVSLIEGTYINTQKDKLNFKPSELLDGFEQLEKDRQSLIKCRNFEDIYKNLVIGFSDIKNISSNILNSFHTLYSSCSFHRDNLENSVKEASVKKEETKSNRDKIKHEGDQINRSIDGLNGQLDELQKHLNTRKFRIKDYEELVFGDESDLLMFNGDIDKISEQLDSYIDLCKEDLQPYKSYEKTKLKLLKDEEEFKQLEDKKNQLEQKLINIENLFIENSDVIAPEKLIALNEGFSSLPNLLSSAQVTVINQFTQLFVNESDVLKLGDVIFGDIKPLERFSKNVITKELENVTAEQEKLKRAIESHKKAISPNWEEHKVKIEQDILKTRNDLKLIIAVSDYYDEYKSQRIREKELVSQKSQYEETNKNNRVKFKEAKDAFGVTEIQERKLIIKRDAYINFGRSLEGIKQDKSFKYEPDFYVAPELLAEVTDNDIVKLRELFHHADDINKLIRDNFKIMVNEQILQDDNSYLMDIGLDIDQLNKTLFVDLQAIYQGLERDEEQLNDMARNHADVTINLTKALGHQIKHFSGYINRFNEELARFKLSNVDGVRLHMTVDPQVQAFIDSVESLDVGSDDAISSIEKGLFNQVRNFIESMKLNSAKNMAVTGEKLVSNIELEYKFDGEWDKKEGSNGTSLTSSVMLLSLFIQQLLGSQYILSIPLNLDETSNVDFVNMKNICDFVKERHLILFSASPDLPLGADDVFKKFINLDDSEIFDPELLVSKDFKTTYHYSMGGMFEPIQEG
ncbi:MULTISPECIES: hypothetical protein [unclassified Colwellia]|uniref:hypothetical protein n=1 Tax=unclassified Colwellia TaxID=196834 RepID=UPI0015F68AF4|nr:MULTISPECIES: hypothetical protein [unclassified Colwellia]MBA6232183.1 hypothetical protein [Colwellia sp. MB02u-7]MBA6237119.1 hypothetical protein [Colwellia sp. MB02u-11]MBA6301617.1 hypothetical protein [Colwellia sp. MB3u-22]MBA6311503.1 hypothetical protein [Colwellia sp. MB3u-64]